MTTLTSYYPRTFPATPAAAGMYCGSVEFVTAMSG